MSAESTAIEITENLIYTRKTINSVANELYISLTDEIKEIVFSKIGKCQECNYYCPECLHSAFCEYCTYHFRLTGQLDKL